MNKIASAGTAAAGIANQPWSSPSTSTPKLMNSPATVPKIPVSTDWPRSSPPHRGDQQQQPGGEHHHRHQHPGGSGREHPHKRHAQSQRPDHEDRQPQGQQFPTRPDQHIRHRGNLRRHGHTRGRMRIAAHLCGTHPDHHLRDSEYRSSYIVLYHKYVDTLLVVMDNNHGQAYPIVHRPATALSSSLGGERGFLVDGDVDLQEP